MWEKVVTYELINIIRNLLAVVAFDLTDVLSLYILNFIVINLAGYNGVLHCPLLKRSP